MKKKKQWNNLWFLIVIICIRWFTRKNVFPFNQNIKQTTNEIQSEMNFEELGEHDLYDAQNWNTKNLLD